MAFEKDRMRQSSAGAGAEAVDEMGLKLCVFCCPDNIPVSLNTP